MLLKKQTVCFFPLIMRRTVARELTIPPALKSYALCLHATFRPSQSHETMSSKC